MYHVDIQRHNIHKPNELSSKYMHKNTLITKATTTHLSYRAAAGPVLISSASTLMAYVVGFAWGVLTFRAEIFALLRKSTNLNIYRHYFVRKVKTQHIYIPSQQQKNEKTFT
jgi:hypothetical protein